MKLQNGRVMTTPTDVGQPNEYDQTCMQQAHEALQSVFDQAIAMGHQHQVSAITVRRDNKGSGHYATGRVTHFICGISKTKHRGNE